MDLWPSFSSIRDNLYANLIWVPLAVVGAAMLTAWTWLRETVSTPVLIVFAIGIFGIIMFAINQAMAFPRRKRTPYVDVGVDLVKETKVAGIKFPPKLPLPIGYDRLIPVRSSREGEEEGYKQATHVWAASIAGVYFSLLLSEARAKIDRVILVDPGSDCMRILTSIQKLREKSFSDNVEQAVRICKSEEVKVLRKGKEIQVRLSSHPVLNVVLFDPETRHAWARIQEFIPYFLGEDSFVYAIRREEWERLYDTIEDSFKRTWEKGRVPTDMN